MTMIAECTFQPWVGERYFSGIGPAGHRVLFLGEAHYPWDDGPRDVSQATIETVSYWCLGPRRARFFTVTHRAVSRALAAPTLGREDFWHSVAFYNYVQQWVGSGPRQRPTDENWASGRGPLRAVISELRPDRVVVLGKALWDRMIPGDATRLVTPADGIPIEIREYRGRGHSALAAMVHHPSSGFRYARWVPRLEALFAFDALAGATR